MEGRSWIRRLNTAETPVLPKTIDSFNAAPTENPSKAICRNRLIRIILWKSQWPRTAKTILKKKNKGVGITLPNSKAYCIAAIIKTDVALRRDRHTDRWSGIEDQK